MSLLVEVLNWGKGLSPWQGDAMRRLFAKGKVATDDLDDLYALLKAEHGIPDSKKRMPVSLTADNIPAGAENNLNVELLAIKDLVDVNAIAKNQNLTISQTGLTVIYGDNGSGKSGYSRVLKKACRARDQSERIYPNANNNNKKGPARAKFDVLVDGAASELTWEDGKASPSQLSALSIFDSRCARAYLDDEDDFSYIPYGLDIMEGLAKICQNFMERIKKEQAQCAVDNVVFGDLNQSQTTAGKLIQSLSANTKVTDVDTLSTLNAVEIARHDEIGKILKTENPKENAKQLRIRAARIRKLSENTAAKLAIVSDEVLQELEGLCGAYYSAKAATKLAAKSFGKNDSLLPTTGGDAWKELFEAARKFALEAYSGKELATLNAEDQCPLCQEPLNDGAARIASFDSFIRNKTAESEINAKRALDAIYKTFELEKMVLDFDDMLFQEIADVDEAVANSTREFEKFLSARHKATISACVDQKWNLVPVVPADPTNQLVALSTALRKNADDLDKAADETVRATLQKEFDELDARLILNKLNEVVLSAIQKYLLAARLAKCATAVKTNSITTKTAELVDKVVNKDLADALNCEFKALGAGNLHVSLATRVSRGETLYKLKLELPNAVNPTEILSEGEQRAIAIGSFLAEVKMSNNATGVIFDDPVSSLDHRRREHVANRLAEEAMVRQVVIFTHDIYFLCVLMESAQRISVPIVTKSLTKKPEGFGVVVSELPFEGMVTKQRIGALRDMYQCIKACHKAGDEPESRRLVVDFYRHLRIAWERAVEEVLLQGVVLRFRKGVETNRLIRVVVEDDDYQLIYQSMSKCSNYVHDQAQMGGTAVLAPDELLVDIDQLDDWRKSVDLRAQNVAKQRKSSKKTRTD